jgi:hypothetical protein
MAEFGIIASQPGYDAKSCPDNKLLFSTKHRTLKILKEGWGSFDVVIRSIGGFEVDGDFEIEVTHNLGFYPMYFFCVEVSPGVFEYAYYSHISKTKLTAMIHSQLADHPGTFPTRYHYFILDVDLEATFEDVTGDPYVPKFSIEKEYGILVSEPGQDVKTMAPNFTSLSSNGQSLAIHKQGNIDTYDDDGITPNVYTVAHHLPYAPETYIYTKNWAWGNEDYQFVDPSSQHYSHDGAEPNASFLEYRVNGTNLVLNSSSEGKAAYVMLKDSINLV